MSLIKRQHSLTSSQICACQQNTVYMLVTIQLREHDLPSHSTYHNVLRKIQTNNGLVDRSTNCKPARSTGPTNAPICESNKTHVRTLIHRIRFAQDTIYVLESLIVQSKFRTCEETRKEKVSSTSYLDRPPLLFPPLYA